MIQEQLDEGGNSLTRKGRSRIRTPQGGPQERGVLWRRWGSYLSERQWPIWMPVNALIIRALMNFFRLQE